MQKIRLVLLHGSHAFLIPVYIRVAAFVYSFTPRFKTGSIEKSALLQNCINNHEKLSGKGNNR